LARSGTAVSHPRFPDNGTFAEFVEVPAANVFPRTAHLSDEGAAALPRAGLAAYRAVVTRGRVQRGETALVLGIGAASLCPP
jgi:NADPH:quinone reductase-like Zn-dependent oxidoreductase